VYGDFTKGEKEKASTRTPFVVEQRKDVMTDLEKCCMTTELIQPLHSQVRTPLGRFHCRKKFPFSFSVVDDCWETYPSALIFATLLAL